MSDLFNEKSLLAKLMAEENIIIEQRPVETASFSLVSRVLTIPTFKETVSSYILDVLFSHEIAHAKYTPTDDWLDVLRNKIYYEDETSIPKDILNIVEDARIERLIKNKYPGLKPSYIKGYNELIELGFFGEKIKKDKISEFKFIDKMNIFFKIGHIRNYDYEFNEIETDLVKEVSKTETFDDVIEVSKKISDYLRTKWENMTMEPSFEGSLNSFEESNEESYPEGYDDFSHSEIEEEFNQNKFELYSHDYIVYADIITHDYEDKIVDYKVLYQRLINDKVTGSTFSRKNFINFKRKYNSIVSYLVKEFELRKNADQFKKTKISSSGDINLDKLFSYKLTNNIFKKISITPDSKSHGLIFLLDWSGSMDTVINETIKQLLCLVLFCQKCNIPYEVYAFSNYYNVGNLDFYRSFFKNPQNSGKTVVDSRGVSLLNILSSKMNSIDFSVAANMLLSFAGNMIKYDVDEISWVPSYFQLGGTPLNTAIINSIDIVNEFKKNYKLQIVNTVILTDGESNSNVLFKLNSNDTLHCSDMRNLINSRSVFRYGKYKQMQTFSDDAKKYRGWKHASLSETEVFINLLKKCTDSNVIGFYVMPNRHLKINMKVFFSSNDIEKEYSQFRKNNCISVQKYGFDDYHLIKYNQKNNWNDDDEGNDDEFEFNSNNSAKAIAKKFSNYLGKKLDNRIILQKFIQKIS